MVIKILFLITLFTSSLAIAQSKLDSEKLKLEDAIKKGETVDSAKYSQRLKDSVWKEYEEEGSSLLKEDSGSSRDSLEKFKANRENLMALEYKENETENLNEKVLEHQKTVQNNEFHKITSAFIQWLSWQDQVSLKTPTSKADVIITNTVYCGGGSYGYENQKYHYYVDGCFFYGYANSGDVSNNLTYHQSDVSTYGVKASPGAGLYVSSLKVELGVKVPLLYIHQKLDNPSSPGSTITGERSFRSFVSSYLLFPFNQWNFQMEFGKSIGQETTLWSLGAGYRF